MNDSTVRKSLKELHAKQDAQTNSLSKMQVAVAKQDARMESYSSQQERLWTEMREMNQNMSVYNAELKVHIAGVMELKEQNKLMREEIAQRDVLINQRLEYAERPIKWAETTAKYAKIIGYYGTGGAVVISVLVWIAKVIGDLFP